MKTDSLQLITMNGEVRGTLYWTYGLDHHEAKAEGWFQLNERGNGLVKARRVGSNRWFACTDIDRCTLFVPHVKPARTTRKVSDVTKPNKARCEQFAKEHNLTITIDRWRERGEYLGSVSVDLPEGMITTTGYCGQCGEAEGQSMESIWSFVWNAMHELTSVEWLAIEVAIENGVTA
ncbi:hypothetical protein UFOVP665_41 [uncultured Caudovirales phage]|uniref:Uncharacterized protein n=1 Tax=uncultured Caudovirales phage TaxID=2100421 RepID=A0A6J5NBS3_9CAUD|nr:hypothetical protein UFOVP665_41 [uncultured Caudovirales phage]